ncbi:MAG: hypothetical protein WC510_06410 [Candidatus Omnitrophota bacterium]
MRLNKKQLIVGWGMIVSISTVILYAIIFLPMRFNPDTFINCYKYISIFGFSLIFILRK